MIFPQVPIITSNRTVTNVPVALFINSKGVAPITTVTEEDLRQQPKRDTHKDLLDKFADLADQNSVGLPVGCQVVALPWHDEVALRVMRELEDAAPFKEGKDRRVQLVTSYLEDKVE